MLWYVLNPLIIIEIMVNVHFEGFMVFFFIMSLYFLKIKAVNKAVVSLALSISAKLIPLLFLPFFLFKWKTSKAFSFYIKLALMLSIFFLPMLLQFGEFSESLDLYFRKFEFNASFYYVFRALGNLWKGYNMIAKIGPAMAIAVFGIVMILAYKMENIYKFSLYALTVFLLLSTTVHPWYLALGVLLSSIVGLRYMLIWSVMIVLSYSKYGLSDNGYLVCVGLEYAVVFSYIFYEWRRGIMVQESRLPSIRT